MDRDKVLEIVRELRAIADRLEAVASADRLNADLLRELDEALARAKAAEQGDVG